MTIGFNSLITDDLLGRSSEESDFFGDAVAVGDFDNDGIDDLAIGVPGEEFGFKFPFPVIFDPSGFPGIPESTFREGAVQVIYGASGGFRDNPQELIQDNLSDGASEDGDGFGHALGVGDINNDSFDDLVIGIPGEDVGDVENAGAIHIVYGSEDGLDRDNTQIVDQRTPGIKSIARENEFFGSTIEVADFSGDGIDDVAIGSLRNRQGSNGPSAGSVNVIFGGSNGLGAIDQFFNRSTPGVLGVDRDGDQFGKALAAGDFDDDGHQDLAIGTPGADNDGINNVGTVTVLYGINGGLSTRDSLLGQGDSDFNAPDFTEAGDQLGSALAAADFNNDGVTDLAIGVPGEDDMGAVQVHYGRRRANLPGNNQDGEVELIKASKFFDNGAGGFGSTLEADDLNGDGFADLIVGDPFDDAGLTSNAGQIRILFGSEEGFLDSADNVINSQPIIQSPGLGLPDLPEAGDLFGISLGVGNFNSRFGPPEIAVGSQDTIGGENDAGAVTIVPADVFT